MKKIIIFGATGNTGAYLTEYLVEKLNQFEVIAVGRKKTDFFTRKYGIKYFSVDIKKKEEFDKLPKENIYAIINLAAVLPAYMEGYKPDEYIETNIIGAFNVLEFAKEVGADRIIYPQSEGDLSEYWGKEKVIKPYMERKFSFKGDHALYVISKNTAVDMIKHYSEEYKIKGFIFRCPTIYAYTPNKYFYVNGEKKVLAYRYLMDRAMSGEDIEMWGDPTKAKDIVYVRDFCQMIYKALLVEGIQYAIYNVGTGIAVSLEEQINGLIEVFSDKKQSNIVRCPEKPNSRDFMMDIENARNELGYNPEYMYMDYLRDFKREMKINRFRELREE